jgi:tetratricopeptide (TPR) repeat protein
MNEAYCLHALARIASEERRADAGIELYRQALHIYEEMGNRLEALNVRAHLGCEYMIRGTVREGVRILTETLEEAKKAGYRRSVAYPYSMMGIGYFKRGDYGSVKKYTRESDAVAGSGDVRYVDILFLNAYYLWKISRAEGNLAQERIAFGRLKYLRPSLERTFPEVTDFDGYIEKGKGQ